MKLGPSGSFRGIDREKEMVRLGSETLASGRLSATAMRRGLEVLRKYGYLVKNGGLRGFSPLEIEMIALVARNLRQGHPRKRLDLAAQAAPKRRARA